MEMLLAPKLTAVTDLLNSDIVGVYWRGGDVVRRRLLTGRLVIEEELRALEEQRLKFFLCNLIC